MSGIDKYLVPEDAYEADNVILEKYIAFSSELLRVSLLALGGYGALITAVYNNAKQVNHLRDAKVMFLSMVLFAFSAGATLVHRYYASDSLSWQVALLRAHKQDNDEKLQKEYRGWVRALKLGERWLMV